MVKITNLNGTFACVMVQCSELVKISNFTKAPACSVSVLWLTSVLGILGSDPLQDFSSGALCEFMTIAEY